jgi:hypothetical protein
VTLQQSDTQKESPRGNGAFGRGSVHRWRPSCRFPAAPAIEQRKATGQRLEVMVCLQLPRATFRSQTTSPPNEGGAFL